MKIFKYPVIPQNTVQCLTMPSSSTILSAIEQNGEIVVYALVPDPDATSLWDDTKRILVLGTGWEFNESRENDIHPFNGLRFINTVKIGAFVWHVLELVEPKEADAE